MNTKDLALIGMFAAVLSVISQISLPMPTGMPVTIQLFGISLTGAVLGWKRGFLAVIVYILMGAIGLPVFANFRGGLQSLAGISGGYILAWPVMVVFCGIHPKLSGKRKKTAIRIVLTVIGVLIVEIVGGLQWAALSGDRSFAAIMVYSFVAFVPKDIFISILALPVADQVRKSLQMAECGRLQ